MITDMQSTGRDFLSDLPLSIIHTILDLVPIRDAVRTSTLSRKWRYTWGNLPRLVFNDQCVSPSSEDEQDAETRLKHFITRALILHKGPILKFKLDVTSMSSCPDTDLWLLYLSRKDIRKLDVKADDLDSLADWFRVHSSVYDCQKLTRLDLFVCRLPLPPPTFTGFPCLKSLYLVYCFIPSDAIESIIANSPLLEKFRLSCATAPDIRIRAPNLKTLRLTSDHTKISLYAPLLTEMIIAVYSDEIDDCLTIDLLQEESQLCNYSKFLDGFRNLQVLDVTSFFLKYLSIGIESCHESSLAFHHLKTIFLQDMILEDTEQIPAVYRLLMDAPNLQRLVVNISRKYDDSEAPQVGEMKFIRFLLQRSPMLEEVTFGCSSSVVAEQLQKLSVDLLKHNPASLDVEFLVE